MTTTVKTDKCELIPSNANLENVIKSRDRVFVLFYASWCPFSQMFLPVFLDCAETYDQCFRRMIMDDEDDLVRKYGIEVYPTVLFFENGRVTKRLDGIYHVGLNKSQLGSFVRQCSAEE